MRAFMCIDERDRETVTRVPRGTCGRERLSSPTLIDGRVPRGYNLAIRGLLGCRNRRSEKEEMAPLSETAAGGLLADAEALLKVLCPDLCFNTQILSGSPNQRLVGAADAGGYRPSFSVGEPGDRGHVRWSRGL